MFADIDLEVLALGLGKHTFNVDPKLLPSNFLLYWLDEMVYQIVMTLVKSSILCFYVRFSPRIDTMTLLTRHIKLRLFPDSRFRYACYGMLVFAITTGVTFLFVTIFQCTPIREYTQNPDVRSITNSLAGGVFDKSIEHYCLDNNTATFASSGFSMAIDFMILLMPIPRLLKLKVQKAKRNSVIFMFSFGLL